MTAKEYLNQYHNCELRIESCERRIDRLKEQAKSITQTLSDHVRNSNCSDRVAKIIDTYVDMECELETAVRQLKETQQTVRTAIDCLTDSRQRAVLERYYLESMTFEEIAEDLNYTCRWVAVLHGKALTKIKDFMVIHIEPMIYCKVEKD